MARTLPLTSKQRMPQGNHLLWFVLLVDLQHVLCLSNEGEILAISDKHDQVDAGKSSDHATAQKYPTKFLFLFYPTKVLFLFYPPKVQRAQLHDLASSFCAEHV